MKKLQIPSAVVLVVGLAMFIWGCNLPLHYKYITEQTTGEFIIDKVLTMGGILIALIAAFGLGRSRRAENVSSSSGRSPERPDRT
jgi:hypothetical protein